MQRFRYKVKDEENKTIRGEVEAADKEQAIRLLRNKRYIIIDIGEYNESELTALTNRFARVKVDDVVNFTRQLSTMISAGLPLTESLSILKVQSPPAMSEVVGKVQRGVEEGLTLTEALKQSSDVFPDVYIALVKAGESAGVLDNVLKRLALNMEKQRDFRNKTKGALTYPIIILLGMVAVTTIMMIFVVPRMTQMYKDFGAELPWMTKVLIGTSDFMVKFWYLLFLGVGAGIYFFRKWSSTEAGALIVERTLFKLPIVGPLKTKIVLTEFTRTMGLLVGSGVSILNSLKITADALGSKMHRAKLLEVAEKVEKGQSLGVTLVGVDIFPPIIPQMISVGEQTGKVDEILSKLSDYFEQESEAGVKTLTTAIEPLIMVVMGVGVGFLVMAVITPIYNLTNQF